MPKPPGYWVSILLLWIFAGSAGCSTKTTEDFRGRDHGILFPSFRTALSLTDNGSGRSPANPNLEVKGEVDLVYGSGEATQGLNPSEFMRYDGTTFTGPVDIEADYDLVAVTASIRPQIAIEKLPLTVSPLGGIGYQQFRLKLSAQGQEIEDRTRSIGPFAGLQIDLHLTKWMALYGRLSGSWGFIGNHYALLGRAESGVAVSPVKNLSLVAGWNRINYAETRSSADVDAGFSGPLIGVHLNF